MVDERHSVRQALVPVIVGGLLALAATLVGTWYGHKLAQGPNEAEIARLKLIHQLDLQRIGSERLLALQTQYVSRFMGQAALCVRLAEEKGSGQDPAASRKAYMKCWDQLFNLREAAGLFVSDRALQLMTDLTLDIRQLAKIMDNVPAPPVAEMRSRVEKVDEDMRVLRRKVKQEIVASAATAMNAPSKESTVSSPSAQPTN